MLKTLFARALGRAGPPDLGLNGEGRGGGGCFDEGIDVSVVAAAGGAYYVAGAYL